MNLSNFTTLAEAKAHTVTSGKLIHRDTMNSLLAREGIYVAFKAITLNDTHPFQNLIAAFMDSQEFNFMQGNPTGDAQTLLLDTMIAANIPESSALANLKPILLSLSNPVNYPFANATQHDFDKAKGAMVYAQVTPQGGWLKVTTIADCEAHRPQIYAEIQGIKRRVAGFDLVETAGDYLAQVPAQYSTLFVDNAYGVMG